MSNNIKSVGIGIAIVAAVIGVLWAIIAFFSWATPDALSNDQIIAETKKCEDAGMEANQILNGFTYDVTKVICSPKAKK